MARCKYCDEKVWHAIELCSDPASRPPFERTPFDTGIAAGDLSEASDLEEGDRGPLTLEELEALK